MCPLLMLDSPMYKVLLGQNIVDALNAYILDNKMNFTTYYIKLDSIELLKIDKLSRVKKVNSV